MEVHHANHFESLLSKAGDYAETKVELLKLKVADKTSDTVSDAAAMIVMIIFVLFFIFILSIALALLIGEWLGKSYYGFFVMSAVYGIATLIFRSNQKAFVKEPVSNFIINKILKGAE
jgi:hypothetical protein